MTIALKRLSLGIASAGLLTIYGCGGGGGSSPAAATTSSVPVTVVDGAIQNATVCLDKNSNGVCDSGEPFAKTDAAGKVNLIVDVADVGKYPVIAVIDTDAIDADTGAVPVRFTMSAPADSVGVVSPLTTMVQQTIASTGASTADAAAAVKAATGITTSLFQDFTKVAAPTDGSISAATVARMVVVTTQQQSTAIGGAVVGTKAADGATITQADINKAIQKKLLELLPALVTALNDPTVLAATTPATKEAALLAAANTLVTSSGLTPTAMATVVAINTQASSTAAVVTAAPSAGFTLVNLYFTNAANYFTRTFGSSLAQNTPDASNNTKYVERRKRSTAGSIAKWGAGGDPWREADLHWSGNAWVNCPINFENTSTVRDAQGRASYNYCDSAETGKSTRATFDIKDKTMAEVYNQVRTAGYTNLTIADTAALGTATFPAGSSLIYQTSTPLTMAISYYPGGSNPVGESNVITQYTTAVSSGGDATAQVAGVGCNSAEFANTNGTNSTTLEGMMAAMTGTPCRFSGGSFVYNGTTYMNPDSINEAWGQSTVSIGTIGSAPIGSGTAPGFFTGNTKLRVAFKGTGTNPVTYYACKERFNNGSNRNCTPAGTGTYTIASLGNARVMTLNNLPTQASALNFNRVFVERGDLIYMGYQNKPNVNNSARLNTAGGTALLTQLSLTPDDPSVPLALTAASYQGTWDLHDPTQTADGITVLIQANGNVACRDYQGIAFPTCSLTITNAATGAFSYADSFSTGSGSMSFMAGTASGTYNDPRSTPSAGNFVGQRR